MTSNYILSSSGGVGNTQPTNPGLWIDSNGDFFLWNGTDNIPVDLNDNSINDSDSWKTTNW